MFFLILKKNTCQCPKHTDRPWLPWPASPGTSTHTHRGLLLQEPHLSSRLQSTSLLFLNCCFDFLVWPQMWLVTLPFPDDCWTFDKTYCCHHPALFAQLGHGGIASHRGGHSPAGAMVLSPGSSCLLEQPCSCYSLTFLKVDNTYVSACIWAGMVCFKLF